MNSYSMKNINLIKRIITLTIFDFKRLWTVPLIVFVSIISLFVILVMILPIALNWFQIRDLLPNINFANSLKDICIFIAPTLSIIFSAGIISKDVKSHWLRTLMTRPVTRVEYFFSRLLSAGFSIFLLMLLLGIIPLSLLAVFTEIHFDINFWNIVLVLLFSLLNVFMYLSIGAFLSCWLPSYANAFVFIFWLFLNTLVLPNLVSFLLWDQTWAVILQDFFFPSGLSEALAIILSAGNFPTQELFWGLSGIFGFAALALWSITIIKIDKGSD